MGKLLSAGLVAVALFAIPMELTAQCAKCHDPLFGKVPLSPKSDPLRVTF